ncbi:MAG: VWA-like domain-containing protein [Rubrivivax sp.]|nr:VWA-like domain-containing protein [Rubrivivax sp.]
MPDSDAVVEPSAMHVHRGTRAVQRMVEHAPSTGGLALWARHHDLATDADVDAVDASDASTPPAATDGRTVFYRAAFERLPAAMQAGCVAHLVLHIALRHAQRFMALRERCGDADLQLFNICADAIVNSALSHLAWLELPASAVRLEQLLGSALGQKPSAEVALLAWDVERLYRAIDDRKPPVANGREPARGSPAAGAQQASADLTRRADGPRAAMARALGAALANDLVPGNETLGAPQDEADDARQWAERVLRGHVGDGAHSMLRALIADLPRPRTPWEQVLRTQLARALAQRPGLSWSRPSRSTIANQGRTGKRRMPWEPGTTASRAVPRLALVVDVSGSIDKALMERFAREIDALSRRLEAALVLVIGDDRVRRVEHFEPGRSALRDLVFQGGGDTDFTPLLEEAQRHRPDIIVVLTDLEGPARVRPSCPVLWAVPQSYDVSQPGAVAPFGRVLPLH